jgi:hypothetical protein
MSMEIDSAFAKATADKPGFLKVQIQAAPCMPTGDVSAYLGNKGACYTLQRKSNNSEE